MKSTPMIGVQVPKILLPKPSVDLHKWAVIACDQFTSEPEYWRQVADLVGDAASTYHLILPEVYLETPEEARRVQSIRRTMQDYLARDLFVEYQGFILVERTAGGKTRHGLMLALDLEQYDYSKGSTSLIRATEDTILARIPPRVRIRSGAALELPHILVLIDDPERTVIEPLVAARDLLPQLYDFDLMLGGGHLSGYFVDDKRLQGSGGRGQESELKEGVLAALSRLADPATFAHKYNLASDTPVMLFAMGDGNHSLATAKAIWEQIKNQSGQSAEAAPAPPVAGMEARPATVQVSMAHPARYALVEIENIHDAGLAFAPIHRVLFDVKEGARSPRSYFSAALNSFYPSQCRFIECADSEDMVALVDSQLPDEHAIGVVSPQGFSVAYIADPPGNLPVGTLQSFLDAWSKTGGFARVDYVHGGDVTVRLGSQPGNLGFYLPAISKSALFKTVIVDGALPRKTFSMGEAKEKRFYMEARRIG